MGEKPDDVRLRQEEIFDETQAVKPVPSTDVPSAEVYQATTAEVHQASPAKVYEASTAPTEDVEDTDREMESIRTGIEQTRADMSETINAIQSKLSPDHLKDQAREMVREATIGRAKDMAHRAGRKAKGIRYSIGEAIRNNPIPAALAGIGLGWLLLEAKGSSRKEYDYGYDYYPEGRYYMEEGYRPEDEYMAGVEEFEPGRYATYGGGGPYRSRGRSGMGGRAHGAMHSLRETAGAAQERTGHMAGQAREKAGEFASQAREKAGEFTGQAREKVGEFATQASDKVGEFATQASDKVGEFATQASEKAYELGSQVRHKAGELGNRAQFQAQRAREEFYSVREDYPLGMAAAAFVLGALVGLTVPETRREHELMGEMRDDLLERAQEAGRETIHKVQRVAEEAGKAATEAAQEEGFTGQEMMQKAEHVAIEAKDAAQKEAKDQGLGSGRGI